MLGIELTPEHPIDRLTGLAEQAEGEGFDAIFASHHYNNRDEFAALTAIANVTEELALGPGIANPYETHPVTLASRVATLQESSNGRALFGLGAGDRSTLSSLGIEQDRPLRRVLETMQVARRLWTGDRLDHDGSFQATDARLNYEVDPIPVYVGAQGPHMLRMAAKYADGVLYNGSHPRDVAWASERIAEGRAERSEARGDLDVAVYASVSVAADADAAREAARPPVAFIAGGAAEPVLKRHGLDAELAASIGDAIAAGEFSAAFDAVSPEMIDAFAVAGTQEAVADRLDALREYADSIVVGSPLGPDLEDAISLAAGAASRSQD
jgi:5,10-methylenetetrahydromethanopterin reductase